MVCFGSHSQLSVFQPPKCGPERVRPRARREAANRTGADPPSPMVIHASAVASRIEQRRRIEQSLAAASLDVLTGDILVIDEDQRDKATVRIYGQFASRPRSAADAHLILV